MLIADELSLKAKYAHLGQTAYGIRYNNYAAGSVHEKFGV